MSGIDAFEVSGPAGSLHGWVSEPSRAAATSVLFVHPINLQGACWLDVADRLPNRYCVMPDLRGHGLSDAIGPYGLAQWADDLVAVLDALALERVHVVGGSLGGPLGVHLAAAQPDRVSSLIAVCSALRIEGDDPQSVLGVLEAKGVEGMFRDVIPEMSVAPDTDPDTIERIIALSNHNDADTVSEIWTATLASDATHAAPAIRCPSLVLAGEHDKTCPVEHGQTMAGCLEAEFEILPGVGHLPMMEAPRELAGRIATWLARGGP